MFKKLLIGAAVVVGVFYGSGSDFGTIKETILNASHDEARQLSGNSNDGWGRGTDF